MGATPPAQVCAAQGDPTQGPPMTATSLETTPRLRPGVERRGTPLLLAPFHRFREPGYSSLQRLSSPDF